MANAEENLDLGEINKNLPQIVYRQFDDLYNQLELKYRELAEQVNYKPDVIIQTQAPAASDPARKGTLWLRPAIPEVYMCTNITNPTTFVWTQIF